MSRTTLIAIIVIVGAILAAGLYFYILKKPDRYTGPMETATLGVERSLLSAAVWIADEKGYFKDEGLDLTLKEFDSGRLSFMAMLDGNEGIDICTVAPTPIMFVSFDREDYLIISTFIYSDDDVKVIARKDKGIKTAADLKGKKIGTPFGTTGQFFTEAFLARNGIASSEVNVVDFRPSELPSALGNGRVDAIVIWEPHGSKARQISGDKAVRLPSSEVYRETFNYVATKAFVRDNPEAVKRFLKATDRATIFLNNNEQQAQEIIAERLNLKKETLAMLWDDYVFEISLDQSLIVTLEDEARWAIRSKLTDASEVPNYLDYIHIDALEEVKPEAINIIR